MKFDNIIYKGFVACSLLMATSCSDSFLQEDPNQFIDEESLSDAVAKDPSKVQAYVNGAYMDVYTGGDFQSGHDDFGIPAIKLTTDLFCEDVAYTRDLHFFCFDYQLDNRLGNFRRTNASWNQLYSLIDKTNSIIMLLTPKEGETPTEDAATKLGEAYSLRAYAYFWLINLWQHPYNVSKDAPGVPLKTESEYRQERVSVGEIYAQILSDIEKGYGYLKGLGYHNGKVGMSEFAAAGIYSNVLMFTGDYANAAKYAEIALQGGTFNSAKDMLSGFNSLELPEVLWGYKVTNETTAYYASFFSHVDSYMIGYGGGVGFRKSIASELYDQIADTDIRKQWFGYNEKYNVANQVDFSFEKESGLLPYVSNKFRDKFVCGTGDPFTSDIIHMRIAEFYFVAAEAYYLAGNEAKALELLNKIMKNRDSEYKFAGSGKDLYDEICLQKRIETWMEGTRYLDATRRGETIDRSKSINHAIDLKNMNAITYSSRDYRMIFHIPIKEIENNPEIGPKDDNE